MLFFPTYISISLNGFPLDKPAHLQDPALSSHTRAPRPHPGSQSPNTFFLPRQCFFLFATEMKQLDKVSQRKPPQI